MSVQRNEVVRARGLVLMIPDSRQREVRRSCFRAEIELERVEKSQAQKPLLQTIGVQITVSLFAGRTLHAGTVQTNVVEQTWSH